MSVNDSGSYLAIRCDRCRQRSLRSGTQRAPYLGTVYLPSNKTWTGWFLIGRSTGDQKARTSQRIRAENIVLRTGDFNAECRFGHKVRVGEDDLTARTIAAARMGRPEVFL